MATEAVCAKCGGSGWNIVERGGVSGAERCDCLAEGRVKRLEDHSQIPPLYQNASFDNFALPKDNPIGSRELAQVLLNVRAFVREFPNGKRPGLVLLGEPGTGKTHLAVAALRAILQKGFEGQFWDYQALLDRIRAGYDPASNSSDKEAFRGALDIDVLLLDDLGAHRVSDWVEDTVTSIVTHRCNNRKALIATTNLPDPEVGSALLERSNTIGGKVDYKVSLAERIGPRARSRLFEMCKVIRMPLVEDFRLRRAQAN